MLIRQNAPGKPITYIDLGWARGRSSTHPFQSMGGPITDTARPFKSMTNIEQRGPRVRVRPHRPRPEVIRCGQPAGRSWAPQGPCARRLNHAGSHRSPEVIARDNARRRERTAKP